VLAGGALALGAFVFGTLGYRRVESFRYLSPGIQERIAHVLGSPLSEWTGLAAAKYGPLQISLRFPRNRMGASEPLVITGWKRASDYLLVRYIDDRHLEFGFDHIGRGPTWSRPVDVDYDSIHVLHVQMGSLFPVPGHAYFAGMTPELVDEATRWLWVTLDGRVVFGIPEAFHNTSPGDVYVGGDPGHLAYGERFTGRILWVDRGQSTIESLYGPVALDLSFPVPRPNLSLPLVTTGQPGRGDALYVRFVRPGLAHFFYDHWGEIFESGDVPVGDGPHALEIAMPSLLRPTKSPEGDALRRSLRLRLDGQIVWAQCVPSYPAGPQEIFLGENGIGASTCEAEYSGTILQSRRLPDEVTFATEAAGPMLLQVRLPGTRTGRHEPLVVTGVAGRADLLSILYADAAHIRFGLDHWGRSYQQSPLVPIDYSRVHRLEIRLPTLDWPQPSDGGIFTGEIAVLVDGAIVWKEPAEFYRAAPGTLEVTANQIGGSSCDESFTGGLLAIERAGSHP
jgi:hypothetical protein